MTPGISAFHIAWAAAWGPAWRIMGGWTTLAWDFVAITALAVFDRWRRPLPHVTWRSLASWVPFVIKWWIIGALVWMATWWVWSSRF